MNSKQYQKEYYQRNKEELKQYQREYHERNKEEINKKRKQYHAEYRRDNAERIKEYRENNKDYFKKKQKQYKKTKQGKIAIVKKNCKSYIKGNYSFDRKMNNLFKYQLLSNQEQTENIY